MGGERRGEERRGEERRGEERRGEERRGEERRGEEIDVSEENGTTVKTRQNDPKRDENTTSRFRHVFVTFHRVFVAQSPRRRV